jgi:uncharacterized membrane protein YGL010W
MRTQQQWFDEYAVSHQNKTNQLIHYLCVPAIFFSIIGLLMSINTSFLQKIINIGNPLIENWAFFVIVALLVFYFRLSKKTFFLMLVFSILCLIGNYFIGLKVHLLITSIAIFVIAWIGQFYGHHLEGKKPSFLKDLQFLLIGPAWVFKKLFS